MAGPDPFPQGLLRTRVTDKDGLITWPWQKYFQQRLGIGSGSTSTTASPAEAALLAGDSDQGASQAESLRDLATLGIFGSDETVRPSDASPFLWDQPQEREMIDSEARAMLAVLEQPRQIPEVEEGSDGLAEFFSDNEEPAGTVNGTNRIFELDFIPSPKEQLEFFHNGLLQRLGRDYRLIESTIITATPPVTGDNVRAFYPYRALKRVGNEEPAGVKDGVNVTFTLERAPNPATSLELYHNGDMLIYGVHYTLAGLTITTTFAPISTDSLLAFYRVEPASFSFVENETPTGVINGVNVTFTLANNPNPDASLKFKHQGLLEVQGLHYTLSGVTVTMNVAPLTGENLAAAYRY